MTRILVVDDEAAALLTFATQLFDNADVSAGFFAEDTDMALAAVRDPEVKAVFLDIQMPKINGVELAEQMIAERSDLKVVFITGYAQNEDEIRKRMGKNFYGFCYKPFDPDILRGLLSGLRMGEDERVYLRTFSHFDCFLGDTPVDFDRAKSKELLALLTDRRGATVTMEEAITCLWPEKPPELSKKLYRDAVCRLRLTLGKYRIAQILEVRRARLFLRTQYCRSDLWDYLDGRTPGAFGGEYLRPYEWSVERENRLSAEVADCLSVSAVDDKEGRPDTKRAPGM